VILVVLFIMCTEYSDGMHPGKTTTDKELELAKDKVLRYYPIFQDVNVMVFVGFGFLTAFMKTHSWTSVGYNFMIAVYALQLTILSVGFWSQALVEETADWKKIKIDISSFVIGDFGAGTVLITFGAVLGKCSLVQLWCLATIEVIFYGLNMAVCAELGVVDVGGCMYVHMFGAYFGVAATYFFQNHKAIDDVTRKNGGDYNSQIIGMIGTLFLWTFWPSFNGGLAPPAQQQRVMVNTIFALCGSAVTAMGFCRIVLQRLDMAVVLNATLAGGVAIGSASDMVVNGGVALAIGGVGGIISACGVMYLDGFLRNKINLHDTCGVHNVHGFPGILGGILGAVFAYFADKTFDSREALEMTFTTMLDGRTTSEQAWV